MKNIKIADITLREEGKENTLSFKQKIEIAKILDKLNVDVIETAPIINGRTDILFLHSIVPFIKNSILSCPVGVDAQSVKETYEAIKDAKHPRIHIMMPISIVQMEYMLHKKPKAALELAEEAVKTARALTGDVEVSLMDATRAEKEYMYSVIKAVIDCGATCVTVCDSAGEMLPGEFADFLEDIYKNVPETKNIDLSAECSNALYMASACAVSCINKGVTQIKASAISEGVSDLSSVAHIFRAKADALGISANINMAIFDNSINMIRNMIAGNSKKSPFDAGINAEVAENVILSANDDLASVGKAVLGLGYELSDEDLDRVFDEFLKVSKSKSIGAKELEAIIASVAMQVAPTYKLKSYVINNSNLIAASAQIELEKNGEVLQGICTGDGPVDAAFLAIEQIVGHHFELDDFQIQAVTEGRGAMGSSIVKLRYNGKPYSGKGISTDIIGASIKAYINALNKICFEEECI